MKKKNAHGHTQTIHTLPASFSHGPRLILIVDGSELGCIFALNQWRIIGGQLACEIK